jgi:hypothetical protein
LTGWRFHPSLAHQCTTWAVVEMRRRHGIKSLEVNAARPAIGDGCTSIAELRQLKATAGR